jgi:hypothetical protein
VGLTFPFYLLFADFLLLENFFMTAEHDILELQPLLFQVISEARSILGTPDGETGCVINPESFEEAVRFVINIELYSGPNKIPIPNITPDSFGGVDVHYKNEKAELVINFDNIDPHFPPFYGDKGDCDGRVFIKGVLDPKDTNNFYIFIWLYGDH